MTMTGLLAGSLNMRCQFFFWCEHIKKHRKICFFFHLYMTYKCMHVLVGLLSCKQIVVNLFTPPYRPVRWWRLKTSIHGTAIMCIFFRLSAQNLVFFKLLFNDVLITRRALCHEFWLHINIFRIILIRKLSI